MFRFSGILGGVVFFFGVIGGVALGSFTQPLMLIHILVGIGLILFWMFNYGVKNISQAGELLTSRGTRFSLNIILSVGIFVGILVAINWIAHRHNKRWDLTEENVYSLSKQSRDILSGLKKNLKLVAFKLGEEEVNQKIKSLFELYREANPANVITEIIDPRTRPHLIEKYGMKQGNLVYIEYGSSVSRVNESTEEAITNGVLKLTKGDAKKVYFVVGHDEPSMEDPSPAGIKLLAGAIEDEHISSQEILLSRFNEVPKDAGALVVVSPKKPLLATEKDLIIKYVNNGGRVVLFTDPRTTDDVSSIAGSFGIKIEKNVVIDQIQRLFEGPALGAEPIVSDYDPEHAITKNFSSNNITIFNLASSLTAGSDGIYSELLKTSKTSWGETDLVALFDEKKPMASLGSEDIPGPVALGISYEKDLGGEDTFKKVSRVVVFGDSDWVLNKNITLYSNRDLFLNSLNWAIGEEGGVTIRAGTIRSSTAPLTLETLLILGALSFLIPEIILISGLLVWWRRRSV